MATPNSQTGSNELYFMMNMPQWYMALPDEEKIKLAEKYAEDSTLERSLTDEEIVDLLKVSK